ncbi:MAG: aminotransferase class IV [Paracoccaceae bacterium]
MESALRQAAGEPGLKLIETMLWDGAGVPRLRLHLARLRAGAQALGWVLPDFTPSGPSGSLARLRLTLDAHGCVTVETGALPSARALWRLGLAAERLSSADPWLTVKSTRRAVYDRARAALTADLDEVVFQNELGEVCDGTITTVFFDRGSGLRTPPLRCGLLPGVLRAEVGCPEEVLLAEELPKVRIWVGNALRGMSEAVWCE